MAVRQRIELRLGSVCEGCMDAHPGVVDQGIEVHSVPACQCDVERFDECREACADAHIEWQRDRTPAQRSPTFMAAHPQLPLELSSADRRVDLVREGFDCMVRVGVVADSSLVARPLGAFEILNCASPAYLQAHGTSHTLEELSIHRLIH